MNNISTTYIVAGLIVTCMALIGGIILSYRPSGQSAMDKKRDKLMDAFIRQNPDASASDLVDMLMMRQAMARIRRRASDAVLAHPFDAGEKIKTLVIEEAQQLALRDRGLAKQFVDVVSQLNPSEILYKDAMDAILTRKEPAARVKPATEDDIASLTILG